MVDAADEVTRHLYNRLLVATDYASGCAVLGEAGLGSPLLTTARALFENFIATYWGSHIRPMRTVASYWNLPNGN
jgi:hypothetical protein